MDKNTDVANRPKPEDYKLGIEAAYSEYKSDKFYMESKKALKELIVEALNETRDPLGIKKMLEEMQVKSSLYIDCYMDYKEDPFPERLKELEVSLAEAYKNLIKAMDKKEEDYPQFSTRGLNAGRQWVRMRNEEEDEATKQAVELIIQARVNAQDDQERETINRIAYKSMRAVGEDRYGNGNRAYRFDCEEILDLADEMETSKGAIMGTRRDVEQTGAPEMHA